MRLYSIQSAAYWELCQARGCMSPDPAKVEQDFLPAYGWMREQMGRRLPSFSGDYPVWAWVQIPAWVQPEGGDVILTLEVPDERVLLSDFDVWNAMLSLWLDEPGRVTAPPLGALGGQDLEHLWERMFSDAVLGRTADTGKQACIDRVYPHEVVEVRPIRRRQNRAG